MQLHDKLLNYKREMGLLPAAAGGGAPQALPAEGETGASEQKGAILNNGNRTS
jgi:hypothetical protein